MNVILISPHFPPNYYLFAVSLAKHSDIRVLAIADESYNNLHPRLRESLVEYYKVSNLENYEEVLRAVGYFTHKYGKISRIESHNEYWLELDAALRQDFNVVGLKTPDMDYMKKKSLMKEKFSQAGIRVAKGARVSNLEEALLFSNSVGYPVVAKPDIGVGAVSTFKITCEQDFERVNFEHNYFLEEFITGQIVTFDGLVDRDGKMLFFTSHEYSEGILDVVATNNHISYVSVRDVPEDLEEVGRKTIACFGIKERFFHVEFFRTLDNELVGLEINIRPPGGFTMDMFNFAIDDDLYRLWADVVAGTRHDFTFERKYHVLYISRKRHIRYRRSHEEVLKSSFAPQIVFHRTLPKGLSLMGDSCYMLRTSSLDDVQRFREFVWELGPPSFVAVSASTSASASVSASNTPTYDHLETTEG